MDREEYLSLKARAHWASEQEQWHRRHKGNWHRNQANYYKRQVSKVWQGVRITDIMVYTIFDHRKEMIENIMRHNVLFNKLALQTDVSGR